MIMALADVRAQINKLKARLESSREAVKKARIEVEQAEDHLANTEESRRIIQSVGQALQEEAHQRLAGVVSRCLEAVFDEPYEFRIIFERKRGQTEAKLVFIRDGMEINPMDAAGGGVVDVAAFALRLSCIMLKQPPIRRLLILDEPFRFLSREYQPRVRQLLEQLSRQMEIQIIMVTHIPELVTGHVVKLGEI